MSPPAALKDEAALLEWLNRHGVNVITSYGVINGVRTPIRLACEDIDIGRLLASLREMWG